MLVAGFSAHQQTGFISSFARVLRCLGERFLFEVNDGFWCSHFNLSGPFDFGEAGIRSRMASTVVVQTDGHDAVEDRDGWDSKKDRKVHQNKKHIGQGRQRHKVGVFKPAWTVH
jgi:hypothetical protein